jgi:hypothetical protein
MLKSWFSWAYEDTSEIKGQSLDGAHQQLSKLSDVIKEDSLTESMKYKHTEKIDPEL